MEVMYVLLPVALLFAAGAVLVFRWAVRSGQFDDLVTPAMRILGEDEPETVVKPPPDGSPAPPSEDHRNRAV